VPDVIANTPAPSEKENIVGVIGLSDILAASGLLTLNQPWIANCEQFV
jgi:hypothetical protein